MTAISNDGRPARTGSFVHDAFVTPPCPNSRGGISPTDHSRDALQQLVGGRNVRLEQLGTAPDRYGRLVTFVYAENTEQSAQQAMVAQGQARVSGRIGNKACADVLLGAEKVARKARRGLWADPNFAPLRPENLTRIGAARGQFALVEGKVLSVRESGATIYLNFGRRWTKDFTVTILKRHRANLPPPASIRNNWRAVRSACVAGSNSATVPSSRRTRLSR